MNKEVEKVKLTKEEISKLSLEDSGVDVDEIIEEKDFEKLNKEKNIMGKDGVVFSRVFLSCYDYLFNNLYLFEGAEEIDNKIVDKLKKYLWCFKISELRDLIEDFGDGSMPSPYCGEKIKDYSNKHRSDMNELINIFYRIFGSGK